MRRNWFLISLVNYYWDKFFGVIFWSGTSFLKHHQARIFGLTDSDRIDGNGDFLFKLFLNTNFFFSSNGLRLQNFLVDSQNHYFLTFQTCKFCQKFLEWTLCELLICFNYYFSEFSGNYFSWFCWKT